MEQNGPRSMGNYNPNPTPRLDNSHHNLYNVTFHSDTILTLLTSNPSEVHSWLSDILCRHHRRSTLLKLLEDCSLRVANFVDLRSLAVEKLSDCMLNAAGLKTLGLRMLGVAVDKPKKISKSRWDNVWLSAEQVQYAAIDAFVSFEIGRRLCS
ncbi:hypothetical protein VNO80_06949 [Phaseolus coccineus]|uniref:3'-5' exonuclease domain-containing protein n=1 Tax=Phaseolus coccineus TaxID=3886 RepID=A0AAN9RI17_PHACN